MNQEPTERELKLIEFIKKLISAITMYGIFNDQLIKLFNWRTDSAKAMGFDLNFQDEMLKYLEEEFQVKYIRLDPETHKEIKPDENN